MRVALVHDYLNQYGGAERVLEAFCEIWPEAPIFTLIYDKRRTGYAFESRQIRTSFLQKLPLVKAHHRPFLMLMPLAVEQFDLSNYDLVVSDSASFAKGVITRPKTLHICYCHTPTRYVWDDSHKYLDEFSYPLWIKKLASPFLSYLRIWDDAASFRPDVYIANSKCVSARIKKYYRQESEVIYPPVNVKKFYTKEKPGNYFLMVGRFLPYKKFDLAIGAFNKLGLPLKIVGDGPDRNYLKKIAKSNIEFLGLVKDSELKTFFSSCRAFIFPQEEDFGIVALEAMASGKPVVAFRAGGALEFIKENETGVFFEEQSIESLIEGVEKIIEKKFDSEKIRNYALQFDKEIFKFKIKDFVQKSLSKNI